MLRSGRRLPARRYFAGRGALLLSNGGREGRPARSQPELQQQRGWAPTSTPSSENTHQKGRKGVSEAQTLLSMRRIAE